MGKRTSSKRAQKPLPPPRPTGEDATPQRLVQDPHDLEKGIIEKAGERAPLVRRFRASHLDRLHRAGLITQRQWAAGEYYRTTHERCQFKMRVVASYGERIHAALNPGDFGYGLPMLDYQAEARSEMRAMRMQFPLAIQGTMDAFLIHDNMPRYGGNQYQRYLSKIRSGLDALCLYLW